MSESTRGIVKSMSLPGGQERRSADPAQWVNRSMLYYVGKPPTPYRPGPECFELANEVVPSKQTLNGYDELYVLYQAARNVADIPGACAEVGVYRGGSAHFIARVFGLMDLAPEIHAIDTFTGHPSVTEHDPSHEVGRFVDTNVEEVRAYLARFPNIMLHQGDVNAILSTIPDNMYRLVNLDTDLYESTLTGLRYFGPRMSPGGVIVVADYSAGKCAGVMKATTEFLQDAAETFQAWDQRTESLVLVRR